MTLEEQFLSLKAQAPSDFAVAGNVETLEAVRVKYLGRQGSLPELMKQLGVAPPSDRAKLGKLANETKTVVQSAFEARKHQLESGPSGAADKFFDPTLPGRIR
ncbi:MAG: phenylalanine--tRNA ligase subunit alpha, partial [Candidatus Margulisiibacteriota bacterium]